MWRIKGLGGAEINEGLAMNLSSIYSAVLARPRHVRVMLYAKPCMAPEP